MCKFFLNKEEESSVQDLAILIIMNREHLYVLLRLLWLLQSKDVGCIKVEQVSGKDAEK